MKIYFFLILLFLSITQISAQSRKDLIWEYKKLITNDSQLGISLTGTINNFSNEEIRYILDSAWVKKKTIILLQILGYLSNPECMIQNFTDQTIRNAMLQFKTDHSISFDLDIDKPSLAILYGRYLNSEREDLLPYRIVQNSLTYNSLDVLLIGYKNELELQLWVRARNSNSKYLRLKSFNITDSNVACLGPKSVLGDNLTPEGVYSVEFYSSLKWSDFYLAFRVSYPNDADIARRNYWGISAKPGGDINIHGCCISIGCIPIGNPDMEELFLLIRANQKNGSAVKILIFPFKFDDLATKGRFINQYRDEVLLLGFWQSLERIHHYFLGSCQLPRVGFDDTTGNYTIN